MTIKFRNAERNRAELAKEISTWLGMPVEARGEDLEIDIFTITKDGTLVFYEKTDSEMVERLLEHLYDCGYETAEYDEADERLIQLIVELQTSFETIESRVKLLDKKMTESKAQRKIERESIRKETAREILKMLYEIDKPDEFHRRWRFPHMVLAQKIKEKYGVEVEQE